MLARMAPVLDDPELETRIRDLAAASGRTPEEILRERLYLFRPRPPLTPDEIERRERAIDAIIADVRKMPVLDPRTPDEILGYDENGLPT